MQFFFAWVDDGDTAFDPDVHCVEDEEVFSFNLDHTEGNFAALQVEVVNPRVGLLNPGRSRWAWIACRKADDSIEPIFHGSLVGMPADMTMTIVTFEFIARPPDFELLKKALTESLKVAPYWDAVFVDKDHRNDPDVVWQARPELIHIGRTDKQVTSSSILTGEDGLIDLNGDDIEAESLSMQYGTPIKAVAVEATVNWEQSGQGTVDLTDQLYKIFRAAGAGDFLVSSYTGQGLESTWPRHNDGIGAGWDVYHSKANLKNTSIQSSIYVRVPINPALAAPDFEIQDWWEDSAEGYEYWYEIAYQQWLAGKLAQPKSEARFYRWDFRPVFVVSYSGKRSYSEVVKFTTKADMQELVVADDDEPTVETITVTSSSVTEIIDGEMPIGRTTRNSYFNTDRGKQSIDYLLCLARAKMLFAARTVQVSFTVPFERGLDFSCRKSIQLTLPDLPGGVCIGKIISYNLTLGRSDVGSAAELRASVTIACSIGRGNVMPAPAAGDPDYAATGYMAPGYQDYSGGELQPIPGDLTYDDFVVVPKDDGLNMDDMTAENSISQFAATALLTLSGPGAAGNTIGIGPRTYQLVTVLTALDQIKIGIDAETTAEAITDALNATEGLAGISYGVGTLENGLVSAVTQDGIVRVTARKLGPEGNAIPVTAVGSALAWDHPTLTEGSFGFVVLNGPGQQEDVLADLKEVGSAKEAADALNAAFTEVELTMKPIEGGPFATDIALVVSDLMVPKTIDLEAA